MSFRICIDNKIVMGIPYRSAGKLIDKISEMNIIIDPNMKSVTPKIIPNEKLEKILTPLKNALKNMKFKKLEENMLKGLIDNIEKTVLNQSEFEVS